MTDLTQLDSFLSQSLLVLMASIILGVGLYIYLLKRKSQKSKNFNYKNISLMAQNLSVCKPSTRKMVLTELYENPEWSDEEVEELRSVLEGMLSTKLFIDKPGQDPNKGLKAI